MSSGVEPQFSLAEGASQAADPIDTGFLVTVGEEHDPGNDTQNRGFPARVIRKLNQSIQPFRHHGLVTCSNPDGGQSYSSLTRPGRPGTRLWYGLN